MSTRKTDLKLSSTHIRMGLRDVNEFIGVFARDQIPQHVGLPALLVVNTDKADEPGEHWIAIHLSRSRKAAFFNSFGLPPLSREVAEFLTLNSDALQYCNAVLQDANSVACGLFCIAFGRHMSRGGSLSTFVSLFTHRSGNVAARNDDIVRDILASDPTLDCKRELGLNAE